jgi:hypothetical protein
MLGPLPACVDGTGTDAEQQKQGVRQTFWRQPGHERGTT